MYKFIYSSKFRTKIIANIILLAIFFLTCLGSGYAVLNRFDPSLLPSMNDTAFYAAIVINGIEGISADFPNRILVPYLAHIVYLSVPEIGSWNMVNFAMLVVNSSFTSLSALLIFNMSFKITKKIEYSILSCMFFLLNFHITNFYLVSSIDSAYGFSILALIYSLFHQKFNYLPVIAIIGCLIKEVFLPVGSGLVLGWLIYELYVNKNIQPGKFLRFILFMSAGLLTIILVDAAINSGESTFSYWSKFTDNLTSDKFELDIISIFIGVVKFMFTLGWVMILSIPSLKELPSNLIFSTSFACFIAIALGWVVGVQGSDYARFIYIPGAFIFSLACSISTFKIIRKIC